MFLNCVIKGFSPGLIFFLSEEKSALMKSYISLAAGERRPRKTSDLIFSRKVSKYIFFMNKEKSRFIPRFLFLIIVLRTLC